MTSREPGRDAAETAALVLAAGMTAALTAFVLSQPLAQMQPQPEAPRPIEVALSVVEEPPPPPPQPVQATPPLKSEPPPPPPPQAASSPLPPPPPPRPRQIVHPKRPPPPHPVVTRETPPDAPPRPPSKIVAKVARQAPENHSAEAAFVGLLHGIVARNTVPPGGAAYRLSHPSGEVEVGFTISRVGAVSDVHIIRSSGSPMLDSQAVAIVAGQRYPAIPEDVYPGAVSHGFSVPVAFTNSGGGRDDDGL